MFVDNSHRSFMKLDVTVFFTEILPRLQPGVLVGIHDIFLPDDYPAHWDVRYYSEQYLLWRVLLARTRKSNSSFRRWIASRVQRNCGPAMAPIYARGVLAAQTPTTEWPVR